jgi:hypothetical protein
VSPSNFSWRYCRRLESLPAANPWSAASAPSARACPLPHAAASGAADRARNCPVLIRFLTAGPADRRATSLALWTPSAHRGLRRSPANGFALGYERQEPLSGILNAADRGLSSNNGMLHTPSDMKERSPGVFQKQKPPKTRRPFVGALRRAVSHAFRRYRRPRIRAGVMQLAIPSRHEVG